MGDILQFQKPEKEPEEIDPHMSGFAVCIACRHEWMAVVPVGVIDLQCPSCNLPRGQMMNPAEVDAGFIIACTFCNSTHHQILTDEIGMPIGFVCVGCGAINELLVENEGPPAA